MRVFLTGASGFVGSAVLENLLAHGHEVLGLVRSNKGAAAVAAAGGRPLLGDVNDLDVITMAALESDGVIHTAFNHDFSKFKDNCEADRRVIEGLGAALEGSDLPLVITSGIGVVQADHVRTENDAVKEGPDAIPRVASEQAAAAVAARGVRSMVMRLPPSVHGVGDHGFVPILIGIAREKGVSAYIGEGQTLWPSVHRKDAAELYRLALEKGVARARYHAVAEPGVPFRAIAEAIGQGLGIPTISLKPEDVAQHFGWFAHFAGLDCPASCAQTQRDLGWSFTQPGLIADLGGTHYFTKA